jgi:glycosyltransferase involved in cell wall biosynthesis
MITSSYPRYEGDFAGSFLGSLARSLVSLGHQIHVVAPYDPDTREMDHGGVAVHRFRYAPTDALCLAGHARSLYANERLKPIVPLLMPAYVASAALLALRLHRRERFDVIHGHWAIPSGPIAAVVSRLTGAPLVVSLHGGGDVYLMQKNRLYAAAGRFGFARAAAVTVCSQDMLRSVRALGLAGGMVIPYGVDSARFGAGDGARMRARLGIPAGVPVVGALGRLTYMKGFGYLVEALPQILRRAGQVYLAIGGDGDLADALHTQAEEAGVAAQVRFAGHVAWHETPDFYAMCDVVAVPSVKAGNGNVDGLPNVLLEAMASGTAIVASQVAGIPDVVRDGVSGYLVPPNDAGTLAERIADLLARPALRREMAANARQRMLQDHDWLATAGALEHLYYLATGTAPQAAEPAPCSHAEE